MIRFAQIFERSPEHWGELIAYLSMDMTGPTWASLGYEPTCPLVDIRSDLRQMINLLRERAAKSPGVLPDIREIVFRENVMGWDQDDLSLLADLGLSFASNHSDSPHESGWEIALSAFPEAFPKSVQAIGQDMLVTDLIALRDDPSPEIDLKAKLSEWDLQLCARHGWNPLAEDGFPPADSIAICQRIRRAVEVLELAARQMSPYAQRILWEEAQALLEQYEAWMPGPLEPLCLRIGDARH